MRSGTALWGASLLCITACAAAPDKTPLPNEGRFFAMPERALCPPGHYAEPIENGTLTDPELVEASGIVASPSHEGVLWSHNDSGDTARLFALAEDGSSLGQLALPGIEAIDIEDLAAGPCPDLASPCLYLADTGNNAYERERLFVYAVAEPDVALDHPLAEGAVASKVWTFPLLVPDAPANIEAMVVMPNATMMIFYEKLEDSARVLVYRAPWTADVDATLEVSDTFVPPGVDVNGGHLITGADLHPSARALILRTYTGAWELRIGAENGATPDKIDETGFSQVFLGPLGEPQGEAIGYDQRGTGLWTVSEVPDRTPGPPLHHTLCIQ